MQFANRMISVINDDHICPGYVAESDLIFRNHSAATGNKIAKIPTDTNENGAYDQILLPEQTSHPFLSLQQLQSFTRTQIEQYAISAFIENYVFFPEDKSLSRGFLSGVPSLLENAPPNSTIAQAASIVTYASLKDTQHGDYFARLASTSYLDLLNSFQATMANLNAKNTVESVTTAILLGIYEMISTTNEKHSDHEIHCQGAASILCSASSPFRKHPSINWIHTPGMPMKEKLSGIFLVWPHSVEVFRPDQRSTATCLDKLLYRVSPIFREGSEIFENQGAPLSKVRQLREYAWCIDQEMTLWPSTQPREWLPRMIGTVRKTLDGKGILEGTSSSPERVDTYLDIYVSGVWNCYRKVRLILLNLLHECDTRLKNDNPEDLFVPCPNLQNYIFKQAKELIDGMAASMFFHLILDPLAVVQDLTATSSDQIFKAIYPNKTFGGLLLIHSMHAAATLSIVPLPIRTMFKEHLGWIGKYMGVGQATLLSEPSISFSREYIIDGHIMVWAGTLITATGLEDVFESAESQ
ncbi:hypothetical protein H072_4268 [Dactylellina haptotyla CBS 200.50]|uniref:Transcription factor domain-containing protein n=1 Tax=Dactylellina haptotyla (strain CBS 200.50) TaxID=1284197 RepID=S8C2B2_DACHA|nr:hypothetical protein H072_4268 [Dactylellina haptotyla CBS 200.50]